MITIDYIVNSFFNSMTWLLSETESEQVWIVDCGDIAPIITKLDGKKLAGVLLTHAHFDHIYGLPELIKLFPSCKIYTNESGRDTLADPKRNLSLYHETPLTVKGQQVQICEEGDDISLFQNVFAKVYETPGHHPSCITFLVEDSVFTGDAYIPNNKVVTNLPEGDKKKALESLDKIKKIIEGKVVCSGHNNIKK